VFNSDYKDMLQVLADNDLIRNKRATGRDKDRLDADRLEKERP